MSIPYLLYVHIIPKSAKNSIIGWETDPAGDKWLKVRVAAVPEDGKANKELTKYMAKLLEVPAKSISIINGATSRYKKLKIEGEPNLAAIGVKIAA